MSTFPNNLLVVQFGQNYIIGASISKVFIRNIERPIVKGNLFVSDKIGTQTIGQHITQFRETDSNKLLQLNLSPLFHLKFVSTWVALLISYLAYIWSQVRHVCYNYFGFRNLKPRLKSFYNVDAGIITYSKTSEKECKG